MKVFNSFDKIFDSGLAIKMNVLVVVLAIVKLRQIFASLHVTYNITNKSYGTDLYKCARYVTSNAYIGASYKIRRYGVWEPLYFSSFAESDLDDDYVYLLKTCVQEYFPEKVSVINGTKNSTEVVACDTRLKAFPCLTDAFQV